MPRKPRFYVPGAPVHAVQRGHNRSAVFFDHFDYLEYLRCLKQVADSCGCKIHAYVLMTNHVHLLLTPECADSVGCLVSGFGAALCAVCQQNINGMVDENNEAGQFILTCAAVLAAASVFSLGRTIL